MSLLKPQTGQPRWRPHWKSASLGILLGVLMFTGLVGWQLWRQGLILKWLEQEVMELYTTRLKDKLPFTLETVLIQANWKDFIQGKIASVGFVGRFEQKLGDQTLSWRFFLDGSLKAQWESKIRLHYEGALALEDIPSRQRSTALPLSLEVETTQSFSEISKLQLKVSAETWKWETYHLEVQGPELLADIHQGSVSFGFKQAMWSSDDEHAVNLTPFKLAVQGPPLFQNAQEVNFQILPQSAEVLWGTQYYDLPLSILSGEGKISLSESKEVSYFIPSEQKQNFQIHVISPPDSDLQIRWKSQKLKISQSLTTLQKALSLSTELEVKKGSLSLSGNALLGDQPKIESQLKISDLTLFSRANRIVMEGINLDLPFGTGKPHKGSIAVDTFYLRKLRGKIEPTPFTTSLKKNLKNQQFEFAFHAPEGIKLGFDLLRLKIGPTRGHFPQPQIQTSVEVKLSDLIPISKELCLDPKRVPPSQISATFPAIHIESDYLETTGQMQLHLFEGFIRLEDFDAFDYLETVPESHFNLSWDKIRLDQLGKWLRFGEMDGILTGYAYDVILQAFLPTEFDFRAEVLPQHHSDVVFSPDAMKNFVHLFAGEDLDQSLPGIAKWLAFGWPSRLFGGYDIDYAGLAVYSTDGSILLSTLDPPEIIESEQSHFILYGRRFKVPLVSTQYPVVLDGPAMGNFVHHMITRLDSLKENSEESTEEKEENSDVSKCLPEEYL